MDRVPSTREESRQVLSELAKGKFGKLPIPLLVEQVLVATESADFPVCKAALEALQRRFEFARRDGLRVVSRPKRAKVFGLYSTERTREGKQRRRHARPYVTRLDSLTPLRGSCGCPDFVRGSLGLCKHLLAVLDDLYSSKGRRLELERAKPSTIEGPRLEWSPVRPFVGAGDRLLGLRLQGVRSTLASRGFTEGAPEPDHLADVGRRAKLLVDLTEGIKAGAFAAEPAVVRLLDEESEHTGRLLEQEAALSATMSQLKSLKRKLYPYQRDGIERFLRAGRLLLADDMGLGKTTQAIAACHALSEQRRVKRGLLVVPAALKPQWFREWTETTHVDLTVVDGRPEERAVHYRTKKGFLMVGYEQLLRDFEEIRAFAPELVVLDEAQRIKNWATKSALYVKALQPKYRLVLTGTPMENRLDELASIVDFVDDVALQPKWRLVPWHTTFEGDGANGRSGARNLGTLRERLAPCMVRRVRREVLSQLPVRTDTQVPVELTAAQVDEHDALREPISRLTSISRRRPLQQREFLQLMQLLTTQRIICNGLPQLHFEELWPGYSQKRPSEALVRRLAMPKLTTLRALVTELAVEQKRKIVIFSQWRNMLRLSEWSVRDLLADAGLRAVFFTGAESQKLRTRAVVDFHDVPEVAVMFLSDAGGVGLNLQKAASACINLELPWNPAVLEQRIGRIYRLGQKRPIDTYTLVSQGGIETRIASIVSGKKAMFSSLFDGTTDAVRFDGNGGFMEGIQRLLEPSEPPSEPAALDDELVDESLDGDSTGEATTANESEERAAADALHEPSSDSSHGVVPAPLGLNVERLDNGRLRLEVAPELAGPLALLLETLAESLRSGAYSGARSGTR